MRTIEESKEIMNRLNSEIIEFRNGWFNHFNAMVRYKIILLDYSNEIRTLEDLTKSGSANDSTKYQIEKLTEFKEECSKNYRYQFGMKRHMEDLIEKNIEYLASIENEITKQAVRK